MEGGAAVSNAMRAYREKYGMRCSGEIDITRPRWNENPTALIPMLLSNIENFASNASNARFKQGLVKAKQKEEELLSRDSWCRYCAGVWPAGGGKRGKRREITKNGQDPGLHGTEV